MSFDVRNEATNQLSSIRKSKIQICRDKSDMSTNEPITCETMAGRGRYEFEIIKRILM